MSMTVVATRTIFPDIILRIAAVVDCGANLGFPSR